MWAVGDGGRIHRSSNGGDTWSTQVSGTGNKLVAVAAVDASNAWAGGHNNTMLRTTNGGATWTAQTITGDIMGLAAASLTNLVAVAGGSISATTNGGATWVARANPTGQDYASVSYADGVFWLGGSAGSVLRSTDGGATFTNVPIPGSPDVREAIAAVDRNVAYAFNSSGNARKTTNGGATWTALAIGAGSSFWGGAASDALHAWGVTQSGDVWATSNGGATWTRTLDTPSTFDFVTAIDNETIYVAQYGGRVQRWPSDPIPDYQPGVNDWSAGAATGMFGACLRDVTGGASIDVDTWPQDSVDHDCDDGNGDPWRPVPATVDKVAESTTATVQTATAHLRFGFKPGTASIVGAYAALVEFSVVAPNV